MEQRVEILKTLYRGADVLIFDEPTAVLTPQEIDELIVIMKELVKEGKSIILITHKLDEIKAVADRCTVIRRGKGIGTVNVKDVTSQQLADMMVGRTVSFKTMKKEAKPQEVVLSIENLVVKEKSWIRSREKPELRGSCWRSTWYRWNRWKRAVGVDPSFDWFAKGRKRTYQAKRGRHHQ
jgi:ABC-type uncharacterized transport system ATPase subunit